jgi:four helix bundle protein
VARPKDYHDLIVWQRAMVMTRSVYEATNAFPKEEMFGLKMQIRRAAVSIPANIAEGHGRLTDLQFRHFLGNSRGSLSELQTELELAHDLGFVDTGKMSALVNQINEVARLLNGLIAVMPSKSSSSP